MPQKPTASGSSFKKYCRDFRAIYYYTNKSIRHPRLRQMMASIVKLFLPNAAPQAADPQQLAQLRRDGILRFDQLLSPEKVTVIRDYLRTKPVYNWIEADFHGAEKTPLNLDDITITKQTKLKYFDADVAHCPEIVAIANAPEILALVSSYLGCKPTITTMSAWWTKAGPDGTAEKFYDDMFHRDADDYKFIKLFIYLTDVEADNGAHSFIQGSHASTKLTQRKALTDQEVAQNFDAADHLVLTAKSGAALLEDTWGIHRAMPCTKGERLLVHILYSLTACNADASPKQPVAPNTLGVDAYSNRVYLHS